MQIERRTFLKYCMGSAAALGLELSVVGKLKKAMAVGGDGLPTVIWLSGSSCTGCTVSLANLLGAYSPVDVADLLINDIRLAYHPNLMGAAGDLAVQALKQAAGGEYILAVEGGIPTAFGGHACTLWTEGNTEVTAMEAVTDLARDAKVILCVGTCSSFGGIPAGEPNPTAVKGVADLTGLAPINIPGCPTHPDWVVWTIAQLLAGVFPRLDSYRRPADLFAGEDLNVHEQCPRREKDKAKTFGVEGFCLKELGCKGPKTQADCPSRQWNNETNWCIGANAICLGCTEKGFPDSFSPLYAHEEQERERKRDTVAITSARYVASARRLVVKATSNAKPGTVTLTVEGFGPMTYRPRSRDYRGVFHGVGTRPRTVTVVSTGGGSATAAVS